MAKKKKKQEDAPEEHGLSQPQGFTHGMISDLDPHFQLKGSYSDALNIRLTNSDGDTFTVENIEGNSLFVNLADYPKHTPADQGGSTNYATFYDRGPNAPYPAAPVNEAYDAGTNLKLDQRCSIVGSYSYSNQLLLMIVGRFEYEQDAAVNAPVQSLANRTIFLLVDFDENFTVRKVTDLRVCYTESGWNYPDLNMDLDTPVRIEAMIENECISRIYWTDNINPLRTLNLKQENLDDLTVTSLDITPLMNPSQPVLNKTLHGSLPVGVYQYAYKYISENGGETTFSPLSNLYHVSDQSFSNSTSYGGGPKGNLGTQGFSLSVSDIDDNFDFIELYTLFYEDLNSPPRVGLVNRNQINGTQDQYFQHTSWTNEIPQGLEEVLIESNTWDVCKDIAIKDNILFAANLKQKKNWISEKEWNVKVLRWRIQPGTNDRYLDAMLTTDDLEVKHYTHDGANVVEVPNGAQDINNHYCGHGQILGYADDPNGKRSAYPNTDETHLDYDGNMGNQMWTTCLANQRHGAGGSDNRVKTNYEYRYLADRCTLGGESYNYADPSTVSTVGGCRVTFGVKERKADQAQNTSTSPYISATADAEAMQTDNVHDYPGQGGTWNTVPYADSNNTGTTFRTSMALGGSKDPHAAGNKRGYQRGEVYRFGVQVYDKQGAPGNVLWIGDMQTPDQHDLLRMIDINDNNYTPYRPTINDTGIQSIVTSKLLKSHRNLLDHRLSYIYGHAVPAPDVEWFSARNTNNSIENLTAYVKSDGSQRGNRTLPKTGTFLQHAFTGGRSKGMPANNGGTNYTHPSSNYALDHDDTHYLYDLYVNFEFIIPREVIDKISGFRVVRAIRTEEDRRIIQQGLLNQTVQYGLANGDLRDGYGATHFSIEDNKGFDDDPVFVNQYNDPGTGTTPYPTTVEQPEYNTYLNGYLGLMENSALAYWQDGLGTGTLTTGGNTAGDVYTFTERSDRKSYGNNSSAQNDTALWPMPANDEHPYLGPGTISRLERNSAYFGSVDKRVHFAQLNGPGTPGVPYNYQQAGISVSGSVFTLDAPDSAFGIRPYVYREGDMLRIDSVLKLTDNRRYENATASWEAGRPKSWYSHCGGPNPPNTPSNPNDWSEFDWQPTEVDNSDIEALRFCSKRNINSDYGIIVGKYYCYEPYFGIGMEVDGGKSIAGQHDGSSHNSDEYRPNKAHGGQLPISAAKELSDGEIIPNGFFKKSDPVRKSRINGFSNNTLGFTRTVRGDGDPGTGLSTMVENGVTITSLEFKVFDAVTTNISKIKHSPPFTSSTDPNSEVKEEDFTYDTVSTLQMGLRSILIEVNTNVSEVRKYDATNSYFEDRSNHGFDRYSSWFACPNMSSILEQGKWYGNYYNNTTIGTGGEHVGTRSPVGMRNLSYYNENGNDNLNTEKGFASLGGRAMHPHKLLCSIVRQVIPYGGSSKAAIEKTRYIPCGNFHIVDSKYGAGSGTEEQSHVSQVFGGDTFVNLYSHQKTSTPYMKKSCARWQVFPVESYVNTDMRSGLTLNAGDTILGKEMNQAPFSNDWLYNSVYSQENSIKSALMIDESKSCDSLNLPYEIAYSNTKVLGQKSDAFRVFPINQFHDMEGLYGEINRIINFKNEIYVLQDTAFAKLLVNPLSMLSDDAGTSLFTGTGETVENHIYISTKYGTRHRFSVALSEKSLYFVDSNFARLFKYDTEKLVSLGDALGQRNYLKHIIKDWEVKSLRECPATSGGGASFGTTQTSHGGSAVAHGVYPGRLDSLSKSNVYATRNYISDNPLKFLGITSIFDFNNKELLITFHNAAWGNTPGGVNTPTKEVFARPMDLHSMGSTTNGQPIRTSQTLVYNEGINAFISKYSVAPPQWLAGGQGAFVLCPENQISVESIANIRAVTSAQPYAHLPYSTYGSYDDTYYKQFRCNPLSLWVWDKHKTGKKTHFFGKKNDLKKLTSITSPVDGTNYSGIEVYHNDNGDCPDESYIVKVINTEAAHSKVFDNGQIVMTPRNVPFSSVEYITDTTRDAVSVTSTIHGTDYEYDKPEELIINRRWSFGETTHGWDYGSNSGMQLPLLATGQSATVYSTLHPVWWMQAGRYAYVPQIEFENMLGIAPGTLPAEQVLNVLVYRGGVEIFDGEIRAWNDSNHNAVPFYFLPPAPPAGVHFRKDSGAATGDWQLGDVVMVAQDSGYITLETNGNSHFRSPRYGKSFNRGHDILRKDIDGYRGKDNNIIRMRIRRTTDNADWQGKLYWYGYNIDNKFSGNYVRLKEDAATDTPPGSDLRMGQIPDPTDIDGNFSIIEWDMLDPNVNNDVNSWETSQIISLRFNLANGSSVFDIDWVEIGGLKAHKYSDGVLKVPLRTAKSERRTRGTWSKIKYSAKTTDKFNIFAILAKYRKVF